jgi:hypothetical protein
MPHEIIGKITLLLRDRTRHDFSKYKLNTITRRIERRTALHKIDRLEDYLLFVQQPPGELDALFHDVLIGEREAGMNILRMARNGLRFELATALKKVSSKKEAALYPGLRVKTEGGIAHVDLTVRPIEEGADPDGKRLFLILLEDAKVPVDADSEAADLACEEPQTERLRQELRAKEEHLEAAIEEIETSNEELKSTNEELQ